MPPRHAAFPTRCTRLSTQTPAQTRPSGSDTRPPSLLKRSSIRKPRYRLLRHIITLRSSVLKTRYGMKFSTVSSCSCIYSNHVSDYRIGISAADPFLDLCRLQDISFYLLQLFFFKYRYLKLLCYLIQFSRTLFCKYLCKMVSAFYTPTQNHTLYAYSTLLADLYTAIYKL